MRSPDRVEFQACLRKVQVCVKRTALSLTLQHSIRFYFSVIIMKFEDSVAGMGQQARNYSTRGGRLSR